MKRQPEREQLKHLTVKTLDQVFQIAPFVAGHMGDVAAPRVSIAFIGGSLV